MMDTGRGASLSAVPGRSGANSRRAPSVAAALENRTRGDDGVAAGRRNVDEKPMPGIYLDWPSSMQVHRNPPNLRSAQPAAAAAMASASSSPPRDDDRFNLGPRTPSGLAREARAALLRHSPATREGEIGVSRSALRTAYTPSSPLHAVSYAAATEGAQRAVHFDSSEPDPQSGDGPVSIANAADKLVVAQNEVYSAKLAVFRAFCSSFDDTAKQFTSGPALQFAQKFSSSFLQYWTDVLAGTHTNLPTTKPSYATVVGAGRPAPAAAGTTADPVSAAPQNQWQQQLPPRRQGQRKPLPPPTDDNQPRVARGNAIHCLHRLTTSGSSPASAPARPPTYLEVSPSGPTSPTNSASTGAASRKPILAEWASDISAEIVEKRQEWYTYAVQGCPRRFNNIFGEAIDDEKAIRDEVATQTGQTPVMVTTAKHDSDQSPTRTLIISFTKEVKHYWRLFDTTSYARRITKTRPPKQCDNCWDYHSRCSCGRQPRCKNCGRIGHALDTCTATQQCANCRGPHAVDFSLCPARPRKVNGVVRSLNRPEKDRVCRMGLRLFQQHTAKPASSLPREVSSSPEPQSATASDTTSMSSRSTPTSSDAITPEPERENSAPQALKAPPTPLACEILAEPSSLGLHAHAVALFYVSPRNSGTWGSHLQPATSHFAKEAPPCLPRPVPMNRRPSQRQRDKRPFRVFQANVGKNGPSHDCALALADAERYEVILLQEPWTQVRDSRCLTKTHPAYDTYSPVSTWEDIDTRPRVMTYIRRGARLLADQQRPALSRDILWIVVNGVTLVNVYREPNVDTALEVLFAWSIPSQCIIAGDFNARHHTWQVGPSRGHGGHIAEWAAENDLALLNPINTPTNAHGNTIDLAFSNILLAEATVEDHLATSSDHFTLSISLPALKPATLPPGKTLLASDEELKRFTELVVSGATIIPQAATTAADLDRLADAIIDLIQTAARATGRRSQRRPRKAPWWNEECAASVAELRCVRRAFPLGFNRDVQLARRDLRRVVRRAKRAYWRDLIDGVQSDKDTSAEDTIPIPFSPKVPIEEVQDALLRTGNTSPGSDNITVRLLRTAWPALRCHIQRLYQGCLSLGYHPLRFKEAEVVMIEKPGKRDLSKTRSCLEAHITALMPWQRTGKAYRSPLGLGLDTRSAVDLVAALVHDIETALANGQVATLVTMDVQGAFDTVMRNRLILRLRQQGWPPHLVRWAGSFMQDRSAAIRFQDVTTPASPLRCGLAQGSPVSPILFALYIAPIYRLGNSDGRFGYADDTAMLRTGRTLEETTALASRDMEELLAWGAANGVTFDPDKTEVMHFSRKKSPSRPSVFQGGTEIESTATAPDEADLLTGRSDTSCRRASALHPAEALHSGCEAQPLRKSLPRPIKKMGDDSDATSHATLHPADGCEAPTKERLEPMRC
ncbi:hypothetical protein PCL_10484 [Purpureocillium lilacinum]|uniref:Reverse transcriptase domain-containing protein n=1 Tax=Purpureocillium lilacinum TaxID=33203 RepID=A0A2U3DQ95_PURLI|nr:hypothetical protein PCL_10484 [Purpureocillium lilacinum]